jgi:hypothetical protein
MFITKELLKEKEACSAQQELFESTFPEGVEVTAEVCAQYAQVFAWEWAAENLLSESLWKAYEEVERPLWAAYEEAERLLWAAYEEAERPLWAAYEEAERLLSAAYQEAAARLFAELAP